MSRSITFPATVPQYADYWQVSRQTVHAWMRAGELTSVKIGGARRILERDHQRFVQKLERQTKRGQDA